MPILSPTFPLRPLLLQPLAISLVGLLALDPSLRSLLVLLNKLNWEGLSEIEPNTSGELRLSLASVTSSSFAACTISSRLTRPSPSSPRPPNQAPIKERQRIYIDGWARDDDDAKRRPPRRTRNMNNRRRPGPKANG